MPSSRIRDLLELVLGYALIIGIIWSPDRAQAILSPLALIATLTIVLIRHPSRDDLGFGTHELIHSLWILPAAIALGLASVFIAAKIGTLHPLYKANFSHVVGYILWTIYQQFLLQDYFMDRLLRLGLTASSAVTVAGVLFAAAHVPSMVLVAATFVWGIASCALFRRYHNIWMLGLAQGLLGLCFAICVPDALHHHLRVGLGYWKYNPGKTGP
jgi:hypothetical protein